MIPWCSAQESLSSDWLMMKGSALVDRSLAVLVMAAGCLADFVAVVVPDWLTTVSTCVVSVGRVSSFLAAPEVMLSLDSLVKMGFTPAGKSLIVSGPLTVRVTIESLE